MTGRRFSRWDSLEARFWSQVNKTEGCWLWIGKCTEKGYGRRVGHANRFWYPHQLSYTLLVGAIPDGLVVDRLCRIRTCVNPAHLEIVESVENTRRGTDARWVGPCSNGHDPAKYRRTLPSGKNICTECRRISDDKRQKKSREKRLAAARARYAKKVGGRWAEATETGR